MRIPFEVSVDPFYSNVNQEILERSVQMFKDGHGAEHELIEENWCVKYGLMMPGMIIFTGSRKIRRYWRESMILSLNAGRTMMSINSFAIVAS